MSDEVLHTDGVFHHTQSFCCTCQVAHAAHLRSEGGRVFFDVDCPVAPTSVIISSSAEAFRSLRAKSAWPAPPLPSARGFRWANFIEITKDCNCTCAVCFSDSSPGAGGQLSLADVVAMAHRLRGQGGRAVTLSGGEPTLHPQLCEMVAEIRKLGMDVTVASNGLVLAREPELAWRLRQAGLTYLYVQLDTLNSETCQRLRGGDYVDAKLKAIAHAHMAGLRLGLTVTVTRDNLHDVGDVLRAAAQRAPRLGVVGFLCAAPAGRFTLPPESVVNREDIIASLQASGAVSGLTAQHFWPFPRFSPWALDLHPDCAALLFLAVTPGGLRPLDDYLKIDRLYRLMARSRARFGRVWGFLLVSLFFAMSIRPRRLLAIVRLVLGTWLGRGRWGLLAVTVEHFLGRHYQDQERLDRCTTCNVRRDGQRVPLCVFEHPDARRAPVTRVGGQS